MEKFEPRVAGFLTTVEIPVHAEFMIFAGRSLYQWVELFDNKTTNARTEEEKSDAKMCRLVAEWAASCEATLERIFNYKDRKGGHLVIMELRFTNVDRLSYFTKNLNEKVKEGLENLEKQS